MIIIASGSKSDESISATIEAGADAITYTTYGKAEQYFQEENGKLQKSLKNF